MASAGTIPSSQSQQPRSRISMREAARKRILNEILGRAQGRKINKKPNGNTPEEDAKDATFINYKRFAVVLDARSTRVVSSALLSHDLAEQGVAIVENLARPRQPFPSLEAIYICEPTVENLGHIEKDFRFWDSPLYSKAHVFLTRKPSSGPDKQACESLFEKLRGVSAKSKQNAKPLAAGSKRPSRLSNMYEANIDFLAVEENAFHLDLPKALVQLFGPSETQAVWCENRIVDGITALCASLNEFPYVRFAAGNDLGASLAKEVNERVETLIKEDTDFWFVGQDQASARSTLLFLDRRDDLAAPLLHEFTYQALVYDLLESRDALIRYESPGEDHKVKKALLNESDPLWVQFRHSHIAVVIDRLTEITKELKKTTVGRYMDSQDQGANTDLEQMTDVVRELQVFKEVMAKHTMHLAICQACMDKVSQRGLIDLGKFEQNVITGVDSEGEPVTQEMRVLQDLSAMMRRDEPTPEDKLRLACLHAVTLGQVHQETIQKFIRDNQLSLESQQSILGLASLGVGLIASAGGGGTGKPWYLPGSRPKPPAVKDAENNPYRNLEAIARASKVAKSTTMKMSRYAPLVKAHVESICANRMTLEQFPFTKPVPPNSGYGGSPIDLTDVRGGTYSAHRVTAIDKSLSVRKHTSSAVVQQQQQHGASSSSAGGQSSHIKDGEKIVYQGARIIVFIAGGMTYSEIRAINEVMRSTKREVIIGSTHIVRPKDFLHDLDILGDDDKAMRYLDSLDDSMMDSAKDFYQLDADEEKMLESVLIDKKIQMTPEEIEEEEEKARIIAQEDLKKNQDLGIIPRLMSCIPFCGKNLAAWFNADDVDEFVVVNEGDDLPEDDGLAGDVKKCFSCACFKPSKKDSVPLAEQGQQI